MADDPQQPRERDPRQPDVPVHPEGTPVEERDMSPPEARAARGVGLGTARIFVLIVAAIIILYILALLTGIVDLGGDAPQADEVIQESPQVETPSVP